MSLDTITATARWTAGCPYSRLEPDRGVAELIDRAQVAIFRAGVVEVPVRRRDA
jgi:nitrite reductase (NADH) small subunit